MTFRRTSNLRARRVAALVGVGALTFAGSALAGTAAASGEGGLPEDLAFLDGEPIDQIVADAENGDPDCAALSAFMTIGLVVGFAQMSGEDVEGITPEGFFAVTAPVLAPLFHRASTPDDEMVSSAVDLMRTDLTNAIYELRDLGVTDDDLLLIQESFATEFLMADDGSGDAAEPAEEDYPEGFEERMEELATHEFTSITFLDQPDVDGEGDDGVLPWAESCPETAAMFDFDMDPVSVTLDFEVTITMP